MARAPGGRGFPLSARSSCTTSLGGRPIGAAEARDKTDCTFPYLNRDHDGPQGDSREVGPSWGASVLEPKEALLGDR